MVVLGLGDTGLSMTRWLARHGADVRVADSRAEPPRAVAREPTNARKPRVTQAENENALALPFAIAHLHSVFED